MTIDDLDLAYSPGELREFIERAVARRGTRNRPRFYAVTGSHVYGFDSADSDVDLRGFHLTPAEEYASLERPAGEVTVNMDGVTEGFEEWAEVDLRSYELRQFGSLLEGVNYNLVELVLAAPAVMNGLPLETDALAALVRERLPMNVPHAYLGMAENDYYKHLDPEKPEGYDPRAKKFLYVYRGLLGAQYLLEHRDVEPGVRELARAVAGGDPEPVSELIAHRRETGGPVPETLAERARGAIVERFNALDPLPDPEKAGYREAPDAWMRKLRG